jgi:SAM-dependent methyltransferase
MTSPGSARSAYQRIVRDGLILQPGQIDTHAKFAQLTEGVDLRGKTVLDAGCNCGEMAHLAKLAGAAAVKGIDIEPAYIHHARELNPDCVFDVQQMERATGVWDFVIATGCLHYVDNIKVFKQFARIAKVILCDVWTAPRPPDVSEDDEVNWRSCGWDPIRRITYPSLGMWLEWVHLSWGKTSGGEITSSPDLSFRRIFRVEQPKPVNAQALLVYGQSRTGKTSMGGELARGKGFEHLQLDAAFIEWRIVQERSPYLSVSDFVDELWRSNNAHRIELYLGHHRAWLRRALGARMGLDVVIEGYDMLYPRYREIVRQIVRDLHWQKVEELKL